MKLATQILGEIEYEEDQIVVLSDGLYGFKEKKEFLLLPMQEPGLPFKWLQSVEDSDLSFILVNPFLFCKAYDFELQDSLFDSLKIQSLDDLEIYALVVLKEDVQETTINLRAPVVLNVSNRRGKQIILNEDYPYKYHIFK